MNLLGGSSWIHPGQFFPLRSVSAARSVVVWILVHISGNGRGCRSGSVALVCVFARAGFREHSSFGEMGQVWMGEIVLKRLTRFCCAGTATLC